jgi:hypothetical protein
LGVREYSQEAAMHTGESPTSSAASSINAFPQSTTTTTTTTTTSGGGSGGGYSELKV